MNNFNWKAYLEINPELKELGIQTRVNAYIHFKKKWQKNAFK
jgi:hypothetical protein